MLLVRVCPFCRSACFCTPKFKPEMVSITFLLYFCSVLHARSAKNAPCSGQLKFKSEIKTIEIKLFRSLEGCPATEIIASLDMYLTNKSVLLLNFWCFVWMCGWLWFSFKFFWRNRTNQSKPNLKFYSKKSFKSFNWLMIVFWIFLMQIKGQFCRSVRNMFMDTFKVFFITLQNDCNEREVLDWENPRSFHVERSSWLKKSLKVEIIEYLWPCFKTSSPNVWASSLKHINIGSSYVEPHWQS